LRPESRGLTRALTAERLIAAHWEEFNERAAILEFDGGLPRREAERRAAKMVGMPAECLAALRADSAGSE
jgi:hypothetical protein